VGLAVDYVLFVDVLHKRLIELQLLTRSVGIKALLQGWVCVLALCALQMCLNEALTVLFIFMNFGGQ